MSDTGPVVATGRVVLTADGKAMTSHISGELGQLGGPLGQVANIGRQAANIIGTSFKAVGGTISGLGLGLGVVGVAAAAFAVKSVGVFVDVGKEVLKLQRYIGGPAESLSKLRFAAQQSGIDTDKLAKSLGFLSKNLESGKVNFDQYGIATLDAHGKMLPLDTVLLNVAAKFQSMPNGVDKTAEAIKIFGKAGADMIPMLNRGRDGLLALEKEATKYGLVLTGSNLEAIRKSIAAHREQTAAMQGLQVQVGSQVLPVMTQLTQTLTTGVLAVMPMVTVVVKDGVVPAFQMVASVVGGATQFLSQHAGLAKTAGVVIGSVLVPALVAWGGAQARVLAVNIASSLLGLASMAVRAAGSIGILSGSLEGASVKMTLLNGVTLAAYAGIGLAIMTIVQNYQKMQASAKAAAEAIVKSATSPQSAIDELTKKQAEYHKEMVGGTTILGVHLFLSDGQAKSSARAAAGYKATTAELAKLNDAQKASADSTTQAGDAVEGALTKSGLAIQQLGGTTKLTSDQIEQLAASMNIDLTKASTKMALAAQAVDLGYTTTAALKLADAQHILGDWTQDVTKKTTAFNQVLTSSVGPQVALDQATQKYRDTMAAVADKVTAGAKAVVDAQRHEMDTQVALTDATLARANAEKALQDILHPSARTQEQAALDLSDANNALARTHLDVTAKTAAQVALQKTGTATADQLATAALDLSDANNAVIRATEHQADSQAAVNALTPQGIAQSTAYAAAQKTLGDATRSQTDAVAAHADAVKAAAAIQQEQHDQVQQLAQVTRDVVTAIKDEIAANADLTGNFQGQGAVFQAHLNDLRNELASLGLTTAQVDALIGKYSGIPGQINTAVRADTAQAQANVDQLHASLVAVASVSNDVGRAAAHGYSTRPPGMALGDVFTRRTTIDIGEDGDEMALPLDKPARAKQLIGGNQKARALFGVPAPGALTGGTGSGVGGGGGDPGGSNIPVHTTIMIDSQVIVRAVTPGVRIGLAGYNARNGNR